MRLTPQIGVRISFSWLVIPAFGFAVTGQAPGYANIRSHKQDSMIYVKS
jgi:hypothetical protein